jgi:hypothetical protein
MSNLLSMMNQCTWYGTKFLRPVISAGLWDKDTQWDSVPVQYDSQDMSGMPLLILGLWDRKTSGAQAPALG